MCVFVTSYRFGISYLVNALVLMYMPRREVHPQSKWRDIAPFVYDYALMAVLAILW
jgi:hypothetical protein